VGDVAGELSPELFLFLQGLGEEVQGVRQAVQLVRAETFPDPHRQFSPAETLRQVSCSSEGAGEPP
jgi:hypothetical protein